ncbi:MAG: FAD-dependent oxidoreductase, partial [Phycisphaerae bacterium]|nr:FAD-dependent oxidoreductase [Phycisphaerae bacterium]
MTAPRPRRVVIVGGGISGLAAAHRCIQRARDSGTDAQVTLIERGAALGGVIRSVHREGFLLEDGPDQFITTKPEMLELVRQLGLEEKLQEPREAHRRALVVRRGRLMPIPAGFRLMAPGRWGPVLRSPLFSWRATS